MCSRQCLSHLHDTALNGRRMVSCDPAEMSTSLIRDSLSVNLVNGVAQSNRIAAEGCCGVAANILSTF
jgi:hypothetical protein